MTPNRQVDELNAYFPVASSSRIDSATVLSQPARTPAGTPPVTMSWVGQSAAATGEMGEVEKRRETPGAVGVGTEHAGLDELPPEYSAVRAPTTLMEYTFSPNGASSLLVLPPSEAPDSRPLYHVSSTLDPFIPTASVTTVCRGGHPDGEFVGDFDWGLSRAVPTVTIGSRQVEARVAMKWITGGAKHTTFVWTWSDGRQLYWVSEDNIVSCYSYNGSDRPNLHTDLLAIFTGRRLHPRADKRRQPLRKLQVYPQAHDGRVLDYIIIGALMLERRRLSPWVDTKGEFEIKGNLHVSR